MKHKVAGLLLFLLISSNFLTLLVQVINQLQFRLKFFMFFNPENCLFSIFLVYFIHQMFYVKNMILGCFDNSFFFNFFSKQFASGAIWFETIICLGKSHRYEEKTRDFLNHLLHSTNILLLINYQVFFSYAIFSTNNSLCYIFSMTVPSVTFASFYLLFFL